MIKIIYENYKFKNEIEYTFTIIARKLGIEMEFDSNIDLFNDTVVNYSRNKIQGKRVINIEPGKLFTSIYLKKRSIPTKKLKTYNKIPIIYSNEEIYVEQENYNLYTNIDIIQSIFFMLTRYEEIVLWDKMEKDLYGRFPAKESLAYKNDFLDIPIVDEYINWLWKWLKDVGYEGERRGYFGHYDFASCLTHDVDMPFKYINSLGAHIKCLKNKGDSFAKFKEILNHAIANINYKKDPFYTFDYIRNIEKKYNFKSSFYFMNGGNSRYENFYKIDDEKIKKLIRNLENDDCEVGYHYSFNSQDSLEMRKIEKQGLDSIFESRVYGGRNHFLRFTPLESWQICEKVGLLYDTTLSYADYDGFRCGTCLPYKPFDIKERRILNFWEIPLIVMEGTLKDRKYRNLKCEEAFEEIKKRIDTVKKYNGVFTLLWHNSSFDKNEWLGWNEVFEGTMKYLFENNSVGVSGKQLIYMLSGGDKNNEKNINY